ncbi:hypothetical protein [Scleromatobacter humisilvae]|uniref:Uncharacterized protein n=1 Tax=Scleromatobacter humisilvae TaxID=2897159 RepID=A0A9X1YGX8_9BURK|nr:hypothetical protein [Scleromatobacter humisilvae]MCK9685527.1 hypothetical protein [Scleromatobacter humisilvae]
MTTPAAEPAIALDSLLLVLRERPGADKADDAPVRVEPFAVPMPGGASATMAPAWFDLVGDLQLRLVRSTPDYVLTLHASELDALKLGVEDALAVALANLHRLHGAPVARPWHDLRRVGGHDEDADSAYFMDRAFWRARLAEHPEGLVAAVPRTDLLLFAPLADTGAVNSMRHGVPGLHAGGGDYRLSSALFLFEDDRWRVFQPAVAAAA